MSINEVFVLEYQTCEPTAMVRQLIVEEFFNLFSSDHINNIHNTKFLINTIDYFILT